MHEVVEYTGRLHSVVLLRHVLIILPVLAFGPILWAISIGALVVWLALLRQETTKIVVTDRRMIIKRGLRLTVHINVRQIESIDVTQSYLGMVPAEPYPSAAPGEAENRRRPSLIRFDLGLIWVR